MTATIDATVGTTTANSYITLTEADTYFTTRANSVFWVTLSNDDKTKLILTAAWLMDAENYSGQRKTSTQSMRWPRVYARDDEGYWLDPAVIPSFIKLGQFETVYWLGTSEDAEIRALRENFSRVKVDVIEVVTNMAQNFQLPSWIVRLFRGTMKSAGTIRLLQG